MSANSTRFVQINLAELAPPEILETLDVEEIIKALRDDVVARFPDIAGYIDLESEPARILIEAFAEREVLFRQRVNDAVKALLLSSSTRTNLDQIGSMFVTPRHEGELDDAYRRRIQLAPEAYSSAGPEAAYIYHALLAVRTLRDASATRQAPGSVFVTIMNNAEDPTPTDAQLTSAREHLLSDRVKPLTDTVSVGGPRIVPVDIEACLTLYPGPAWAPVLETAENALDEHIEATRFLGYDLRRSAIISRLHTDGVYEVELKKPTEDVIVDGRGCYRVVSKSITYKGVDQ
ncbi:MAG: baseplate J/gp47 family protein [Roseibium sp.]|nr:baseplate J/gp47 family protein [Roseibium sp.]